MIDPQYHNLWSTLLAQRHNIALVAHNQKRFDGIDYFDHVELATSSVNTSVFAASGKGLPLRSGSRDETDSPFHHAWFHDLSARSSARMRVDTVRCEDFILI
jgi:hypothetical protein